MRAAGRRPRAGTRAIVRLLPTPLKQVQATPLEGSAAPTADARGFPGTPPL